MLTYDKMITYRVEASHETHIIYFVFNRQLGQLYLPYIVKHKPFLQNDHCSTNNSSIIAKQKSSNC